MTRNAPTAETDAARDGAGLVIVATGHCLTAAVAGAAAGVPSSVHADGPCTSVESVRSRSSAVVGPKARRTVNDPHASTTA